jgi:hypothetical protein
MGRHGRVNESFKERNDVGHHVNVNFQTRGIGPVNDEARGVFKDPSSSISTLLPTSHNKIKLHTTTHTNKPNQTNFNQFQNGDHQGMLFSLASLTSPQLSITPSRSLVFTLLTWYQQNAANYVSESVQGTGAQASKEANKQVAKDNDASLSSRATAAKDAVGDKFDQTSHETKADVHKGTISPPPSPFAPPSAR